jgi:hypothetical protein
MGEIEQEWAEAYVEGKARRHRTMAILAKRSVPCYDDILLSQSEADVLPRSGEEIVLRAIALSAVAARNQMSDHQGYLDWIRHLDIEEAFTPKELAFVHNVTPSQDDLVQFSWRYECLHVMMWALGFEAELGMPDRPVDPQRAFGILHDLGLEGLVGQAKLRSAGELLDATDLLFCCHSAVRDARLFSQPVPGNLDGDVVQEWHYALNWLIGYEGLEWDDISTDT